MQSSSKLFPVALISAELRGDLTEDVYLLKPNNSPDLSVELALTRLGRAGADVARGTPVVLVHGRFGNRRHWYMPGGHGLGAWLARAGFDVWLAEMRGHGLSPRNLGYRHNCVADYARYDLPAIAAFLAEQCGQPAHWLGHALGGLTLVAALAAGHLTETEVASLVVCGAQARHLRGALGLPVLNWGARLLLRRREQVAAGWLGLEAGPEDEPVGVVRDSLRWSALFGRFGAGDEDWQARLAEVGVPVLALAGAGDRRAPVAACRQLFEGFGSARREFVCLGHVQGFAEDYGHVSMLVGQGAQREVWPLLRRWLEQPGSRVVTGDAPTLA